MLAPNIPIGGVKGQVVPICVQVHLSVKNGGFETWPFTPERPSSSKSLSLVGQNGASIEPNSISMVAWPK